MEEYETQPAPEVELITKVYSSPQIQMGCTSNGTWNKAWKLKDGRGERATEQTIVFSEKFKNVPVVTVSMTGIDTYQGNNTRLRLSVKNVTRDSFTIRYYTWSDTTIWEVGVSWIAIAES